MEKSNPIKWSWTSEAVEIFLKYITEFKTKCLFNGVDFEADLFTMYAEIRRWMVVDFPEDFCPEIVQEPGKELKDMNMNSTEKSWLSPSAPNSIIAMALGTRLCM